MRFLFLTTKYPIKAGDTWMSTDLAAALKRRGHEVDVVLLDWNADPGRPTQQVRTEHDIDVLDISPRATSRFGTLIYRISKMLWSPRHARREMAKWRDPVSYDALIAFTPASTLAGPLHITQNIPARILFIFDFYPIMQREIGMIPGGPIFHYVMRREEALYRGFTTLVCNLPANINYLKTNYRLRDGQDIRSNPLWSDISPVVALSKESVRIANDLPTDRPIAIFGGQITEGRGIELMLDAASQAAEANSPLYFLFIGDGRLAHIVDDRAQRSTNIRRIGSVSRDAYLQIAAACDVGMVATVPNVSSFNFPTKTIDYLRVGLPVVAAVEPGSDYLDILTDGQVGDGVDFTDPLGFYETAQRLATDRAIQSAIGERARKCLDDVFDVEHAVETVLASVEASQGK